MMSQHQRTILTTARHASALRIAMHALRWALLVAAMASGAVFAQAGSARVAPASQGAAIDQGEAGPGPRESALNKPDKADRPAADPDIDVGLARTAAPGVTIIPDPRIAFIPNIGIIEGSVGVLVVDTGLGEANGERVLSLAKQIAGERRLYLTTTHFHPEHNFGAHAFKGSATLILNEAQVMELREKGQAYIDLFKTFGPQVSDRLEGTTLVEPDLMYSGEMALSLGDRDVIFREIPAHTRGDQMIYVPDPGLVFAGDIAETRYFPIMPDADSSADRWIGVLSELEALNPSIVVPGHGEVGGVEILRALRLHIELMRDRVWALAGTGHGQKEITDLLVPAITAIYPDWENQMFLPFEIAILYGEATGKAPELPSF